MNYCKFYLKDDPMDFRINLQLFSEEKTEQATPKKKKETREKGNVLQSKEINSAVVLLASFIMINAFATFIGITMRNTTSYIYEEYLALDFILSLKNLQPLFINVMMNFFIIVAPIALTSLVFGVIASYLQIGVLFTTKPLAIDIKKMNPIEGFKRMFSMKAIVELIKSLIRMIVLGYISYSYVKGQIVTILETIGMDVFTILRSILNMSVNIGIRSGVVLIGLAALDYSYQRYEYNKKLKMSKQETKEEYKQVEGNPQIKSKIKEKQRQMSMQRMMQDVPKADVIITNPTHFAICIRYNQHDFDAPKVIAKGQDLIAQNIKKVAKEHNIPVVENKLLARTLYDSVDIGQFVPPELYQAVAEVLAYVYRINNKIE